MSKPELLAHLKEEFPNWRAEKIVSKGTNKWEVTFDCTPRRRGRREAV